jgi:hypothetical protein
LFVTLSKQAPRRRHVHFQKNRTTRPAVAAALGSATLQAQSLQDAAAAAGIAEVKSLEISGTGR